MANPSGGPRPTYVLRPLPSYITTCYMQVVSGQREEVDLVHEGTGEVLYTTPKVTVSLYEELQAESRARRWAKAHNLTITVTKRFR